MAKKKVQRERKAAPRERKVSPMEALAWETEREHAHANSYTIHSDMRVLRFEAKELDQSIVNMQAALERLKIRRKEVEAKLTGMMAVVVRR